jgi:hypothetical protein
MKNFFSKRRRIRSITVQNPPDLQKEEMVTFILSGKIADPDKYDWKGWHLGWKPGLFPMLTIIPFAYARGAKTILEWRKISFIGLSWLGWEIGLFKRVHEGSRTQENETEVSFTEA